LLDKSTNGQQRLRRLSWASLALALAAGACMDDAVVYPNRNTRPATAGGAGLGEAGASEGGETSGGSGGMARGGAGGKGGHAGKGGSGGFMLVDPGDEEGGEGGAPSTGPVCGDGKIEAPEDCEDGNTISGDGCSANCQSACEICEKNVCPTLDYDNVDPNTDSAYDDCYKAKGQITTGAAMGVARAEVCRDLVDCIRREGCAQTYGFQLKTERCWCDIDVNEVKFTNLCSDPSTYVPGKCARQYQEASESASLGTVMSSLTATGLAEGRGNRLLETCDTRVCTEECVPAYFGHGTAAKITADILAAQNDAGESPLGDLIADSWRSVAQTDFALVTTASAIAADELTGLLFAATPFRAADGPGIVLWSEARAVSLGYSPARPNGVPARFLDTALYKVTLSGQKIYDALSQQFAAGASTSSFLNVSGLTYSWDSTKQAPDSKLIEIRKDGVPLDKAANYTVALGTFIMGQNSPIPALKAVANPIPIEMAAPPEILGEYLSQLPQPISPPTLNRIIKLN